MPRDHRALAPVRDPEATLSDLLGVVLDKGVVLHLDLLVSVADIPLVGITLRGALAGIETMLEHGMMKQWDAQTRAWIQKSVGRDVPLEEGEEIGGRMAASIQLERDGAGAVWRPGALYLTDRRVLLFRREPRAVLWEARRGDIVSARIGDEPALDGTRRPILELDTRGGTVTLLTSDPHAVVAQLGLAGATRRRRRGSAETAMRGKLWFSEARATGRVWRSGEAVLAGGILEWRPTLDVRPAMRVRLRDIDGVRMGERHEAVGQVLVISHGGSETRLAGAALGPWLAALESAFETERESRHAAERG